jgi:hypothetical protein
MRRRLLQIIPHEDSRRMIFYSEQFLLVRRFQIYRTYATFIFNVIKIVQRRLENGSFDGSRCVLCTTRLYLRRIDLNVVKYIFGTTFNNISFYTIPLSFIIWWFQFSDWTVSICMQHLHMVYTSLLIRNSRACGSYRDFLDRGLLLTRKLLSVHHTFLEPPSSCTHTVKIKLWIELNWIDYEKRTYPWSFVTQMYYQF